MERGGFTMQPVHLARPNGRWMARPCGVSMTDCDLTPLSFPMIQGLYHIQQIVGEKKTKVPRSDFVILVCEEWVAVWIKMAISPEYIHVKDMWDFQISTSLTRNHRIKSPVFFLKDGELILFPLVVPRRLLLCDISPSHRGRDGARPPYSLWLVRPDIV